MATAPETRLTPWRPGRRVIDIRDATDKIKASFDTVSDILGAMSAAALTADLNLANLMKDVKRESLLPPTYLNMRCFIKPINPDQSGDTK